MANRFFRQFRLSLEPAVSDIFCRCTFDGSGDATLVAGQSKGIVSVTHDTTGRYTFVFGTNASMLDTYYKWLGLVVTFDESANSGTAPVAPLYYIRANSITTVGTASMTVQFMSDASTPADPANLEAANFNFVFKNSSAQ
jgi:hypothetical protein